MSNLVRTLAYLLSAKEANHFILLSEEKDRHNMTRVQLREFVDHNFIPRQEFDELKEKAKEKDEELKVLRVETETLRAETETLKSQMTYVLSVVTNHASQARASADVLAAVAEAHLEQ